MGLVRTFGLHESYSHVPRGREGLVDPVTALKPYLGSRTKHFWHELRCFGLAPFSMEVYDQVVIYDAVSRRRWQRQEA